MKIALHPSLADQQKGQDSGIAMLQQVELSERRKRFRWFLMTGLFGLMIVYCHNVHKKWKDQDFHKSSEDR
jgi:hypothetical protein